MIAILDYGAGNLTSVQLAFEKLRVKVKIAQTAAEAEGADRIIFPGVGSAGSGMAGLVERGFDKVLKGAVAAGVPVLTICLGMQLLLASSEEDGGVAGLGLLPGTVRDLTPHVAVGAKIPHMGWNGVRHDGLHPLFRGVSSGTSFYFVHSYYADSPAVIGTTEYSGFTFPSVIAHENLFATQFHPERSGNAGLMLLLNFTTWKGQVCC